MTIKRYEINESALSIEKAPVAQHMRTRGGKIYIAGKGVKKPKKLTEKDLPSDAKEIYNERVDLLSKGEVSKMSDVALIAEFQDQIAMSEERKGSMESFLEEYKDYNLIDETQYDVDISKNIDLIEKEMQKRGIDSNEWAEGNAYPDQIERKLAEALDDDIDELKETFTRLKKKNIVEELDSYEFDDLDLEEKKKRIQSLKNKAERIEHPSKEAIAKKEAREKQKGVKKELKERIQLEPGEWNQDKGKWETPPNFKYTDYTTGKTVSDRNKDALMDKVTEMRAKGLIKAKKPKYGFGKKKAPVQIVRGGKIVTQTRQVGQKEPEDKPDMKNLAQELVDMMIRHNSMDGTYKAYFGKKVYRNWEDLKHAYDRTYQSSSRNRYFNGFSDVHQVLRKNDTPIRMLKKFPFIKEQITTREDWVEFQRALKQAMKEAPKDPFK